VKEKPQVSTGSKKERIVEEDIEKESEARGEEDKKGMG
jgi:hypothetical protein